MKTDARSESTSSSGLLELSGTHDGGRVAPDAQDHALPKVLDYSLLVSLSFYRPMGFSAPVGRAPWFKIVGNCLTQGPNDKTMGSFQNKTWEVEGEHFTSFDVEGRATIRLEDVLHGQSAAFAPFDSIRMASCVLWTNAEPFAKFNSQTQLWEHIKTNTYWPVVLIEAS